MTTLTVIVTQHGITALETEYGDNVRYVETFQTWAGLLSRLTIYMHEYAWVEVRVG